MDSSHNRAIFGLLLITWCMIIFVLSSQTLTIPGPDFFFKDKLLHGTAYALMATLACGAFRSPRLSLPATQSMAFIFSSLYGLSDEWHQLFVVGRISSTGDWIADMVGAALGVLLFYPVLRMLSQATDSKRQLLCE